MPNETAGQFLTVDGVRLFARWWRAPQPGKPVLVFMHDGLGSTASLRALPERLADACGLSAFGYDRWGYGRSDALPGLPAGLMEDEAGRLPRVLAAAGIDDYFVVGHSNGGTIALIHAASNPSGLRAAVSMSAHVKRDEVAVRALAHFTAYLDPGPIPEWLVRFQGDPQRAERLVREWVALWRNYFDIGWDLTPLLKEIRIPLMALHGDYDDYGAIDQLSAIHSAVPAARCAVLPRVAHFPHLDDLDGVVERIAGFLNPYVG